MYNVTRNGFDTIIGQRVDLPAAIGTAVMRYMELAVLDEAVDDDEFRVEFVVTRERGVHYVAVGDEIYAITKT